jgi:hypothetical protein
VRLLLAAAPKAAVITLVLVACAVLASGCGGSLVRRTLPAKPQRAGSGIPAALLAGLRSVGAGERFHPPATGPVLGGCHPTLGSRIEAHVELFAENHVVLIAGAVGTAAPREVQDARIVRARCFGSLVTLDPTGTVYVRTGTHATIGELFRSWGEPLSGTRLASFVAPPRTHVTVYIAGRLRPGAPAAVPLTPHAEIVLEVGPHVPPHLSFTFPPSPPAAMR